jgi:hypothetical protein
MILEQQIGNFIDEESIRVLDDLEIILNPATSTLPQLQMDGAVQNVRIGRVST